MKMGFAFTALCGVGVSVGGGIGAGISFTTSQGRNVEPRKGGPAKRRRSKITSQYWTRREALQYSVAFATPSFTSPLGGSGRSESTVFRVRSTADTSVTLEPVEQPDAVSHLTSCDAVLLGVANGSFRDHQLAAQVLRQVVQQRRDRSQRPVTLALECIESRFQDAVDAYMRRELSEEDLFDAIEWESRWGWPYEATALPLLRAARASGNQVLALGAPAELLARARAAGGLENLTAAEMRTVFMDPDGFASMSSSAAFRAYVRECVTPSYAAHARLRLSTSFDKFYTARVVADEAMAASCTRCVVGIGADVADDIQTRTSSSASASASASSTASARANATSCSLVAVMGKEHVKFGYGVPLRLLRNLGYNAAICTVMLNARAADAFDEKAGALKLELDTTTTGTLISDYLWYSSAEVSGRKQVNGKSTTSFRYLPPVERLVSPESVVNARS